MYNQANKLLSIFIPSFFLLTTSVYAIDYDAAAAILIDKPQNQWQLEQQSIREYRLRQWQEQHQAQAATPQHATYNKYAETTAPNAEDLFKAASSGNVAQIGKLLSQGLDVNISNNERETSLHMAAARGQYSAVIYLINHGAYVNAPTVKNWIPLHHAVRFRHPNIANYLIRHGSSANARTSDGLSAIDMANNLKDYRLLSILGVR